MSLNLLVRLMLCLASLVLGLVWFFKDWLGNGQPMGGLSYLIGSLGLCGIFALGFHGWKSTVSAYLIGLVAGLVSILALFQEHPGASLKVIQQNQKTILRLPNIAQNNVEGQNANAQAMQMANAMISNGECGTQNERNMLDLVIQAYPALYLKPEYSVVIRLIYGPSYPPSDACAKDIDELRRVQPDLFLER